jgi:gliding motility-associated-like protein
MRSGFLFLAVSCLIVLCTPAAKAQDFSNKGKDFWIGYGNHVRMFNGGNQLETMQLYLTSDVATTGLVEISSIGFSQSFAITANQITTVNIPRAAALMDHGLYNHGIHVTALKPIVVYSFIYVNAQSGATVCLPTNTLGRDYYSVNFDQVSNEPNSHSYFFVLAADTGSTTVEITPAAPTKDGKPAGVPFLVTLTQGQIYQVLGSVNGSSGADLTGSRIRSVNTGAGCKRIALYCGSGKIAIGCSGPGSADNLYQQMYPTATWGKKYITLPGMVNSNNYFRIVKADPTTTVTLNGAVISPASFTNNFYYQFNSSQPNVIEADKPILVAQYYTTQGCAGNPNPGDPEMIYLNPIEQTINSVTLNSMQPAMGTNITQHYLNVVLRNLPAAINTFTIDGAPYTAFTPVPNDNNYAYARIATTMGTHNIRCDTGFNIIAYGLGNAETYGYSGGTNLKDLYQFASIRNQHSTVNFPATCTDAPFLFSMTFPYQPLRIEWKFNGLYPDEIIAAPQADSSWVVNGRQLYLYRLPKTYTGPAAGVYPVRILAENPTADGCTGTQEIDFDLQVYQKPAAKFSFAATGCQGDTVFFKDASPVPDRPVTHWLWDFDTGDTSAQKAPTYLFKDPGTYIVRFNFITDIGCFAAADSATIAINPLPLAGFDTAAPYCPGQDITFTDRSTISNGNSLTEWTWKMGDGTNYVRTNATPFTHAYTTTGTYKVQLQAKSNAGCRSAFVEKAITVHPRPRAGFAMPGNCLADPFTQFMDSTRMADGSEARLLYHWNFGDPAAGGANSNTSDQKDPQHHYTAVGHYPVSLWVQSDQGCSDSITQTFTINGALPQAAFTLAGGGEQCSNDSLRLTNQSSVDFGNLVRVEIYWDWLNDPSNKTVDNQPTPGKTYAHLYPLFFGPAPKTYSISFVAYSGENCLQTAVQTFVLKPVPEVQVAPINPICANEPAFSIPGAGVVNGLPGTGIFSGPGLTADGLFTPAKAATGTNTLRYTYTAANGCTSFTEQKVVVYAAPVVSAGPDRSVLEGGTVVLLGSGSGNNNSYAWTPPMALSRTDTLKPSAAPLNDITYRLTATSADGCRASDDVLVKVLKTPLIPNVFSPNGDGIHDQWTIPHLESYPGATLEIYNRYGQPVLARTGYKPWDGLYNHKPLPVGTYYYIIDPKNGRKPMTGFVDIIR